MDGFFVAKLRKFANGVKSLEAATEHEEELKIKQAQKAMKTKKNQKKKALKKKSKELKSKDKKESNEVTKT